MKTKRQKGFTMIELMTVITILAVMLLFAIPSYRTMLNNNALRSAINEWQDSYYYAQSEALRLKSTVRMCPSDNGSTCGDNTVTYADGWIVTTNIDNNDVVLRDVLPMDYSGLTIVSSRPDDPITIRGNGRLRVGDLGQTIRFSIVRNNNAVVKRKLVINQEGRLRGANDEI